MVSNAGQLIQVYIYIYAYYEISTLLHNFDFLHTC